MWGMYVWYVCVVWLVCVWCVKEVIYARVCVY